MSSISEADRLRKAHSNVSESPRFHMEHRYALSLEGRMRIITPLLPDHLRQEIAKEVIERGRAPESAAHQFRKAIARTGIKGFRRGSPDIPDSLLISQTLELSRHDQRVLEGMVACWMRTEARFVARVRRFARAKEGFSAFRARIAEEGGVPDYSALLGWVGEAAASYPVIEPVPSERVALVLGYALATTPQRRPSAVESAANDAMAHVSQWSANADSRNTAQVDTEGIAIFQDARPGSLGVLSWNDVLSRVQCWPPEDVVWDTVDEFVERLRELAAEKKRARVNAEKSAVEALIGDLRTQCSEQLASMEMVGLESWSASHLRPEIIPQATALLGTLKELVSQWCALKDRGWNTPRERKELNEVIDALEAKISSTFESANDLLLSSVHEAEMVAPGFDERLPTDDDVGQREPIVEEVVAPIAAQSPPAVSSSSPGGALVEEDVSGTGLAGGEQVGIPPIDLGAPPVVEDGEERAPAEKAQHNELRQRLDVRHDHLIWSLIEHNDIPGAYWLARAIENGGSRAVVPSFVLKALQGARWIRPEDELFVADLIGLAAEVVHDHDEQLQLLQTSAAVIPSLMWPSTGLAVWMNPPAEFPLLRALSDVVARYSREGVGFRREDLEGASGKTALEAQIALLVREAAQRLEAGATQRITFAVRANEAWRAMHGKSRSLAVMRDLLEPVALDRRDEARAVQELVTKLLNREEAVALLHRVQHDLGHKRSQQIVNAPLEHLLRELHKSSVVAQRWCFLVQRQQQMAKSGDWLFSRAIRMRQEIAPLIPEIRSGLEEYSSSSDEARAVSNAVRFTIDRLASLFGIEQVSLPEPLNLPTSWWVEQQKNLDCALARRLLWMPELSSSLDDQGVLGELSKETLASVLSRSPGESPDPAETVQGWTQAHDYRFVRELESALPADKDSSAITRDLEAALNADRFLLSARLAETTQQVEKAVLNGLIDETKRAELLAVLDQIKPDDTANFSPALSKLDEIGSRLQEEVRVRTADLEGRWQEMRRRLEERRLTSVVEEADSFLKLAAAAGETRVMEEKIAQIADSLERGTDLPSFSAKALPVSLYLEKAERLRSKVRRDRQFRAAIEALKSRTSYAGLAFGELPATNAEQAIEALTAWIRLKQMPVQNRRELAPQALQKLLSFLSFRMRPKNGVAVEVVESKPDWLHARVYASCGNLASPFPDFGSMASDQCTVAVVWERQDADTLIALLRGQGLDKTVVILFYLGSLTPFQLGQLAEISRRSGLSIAVLDEPLLLYLSGLRGARLPDFLSCALPYSGARPYKPSWSAYVPPEIFVGREEMAKQLVDPAGPCLVYGGRQMGKSALLRHVRELAHKPEDSRYAWVVDIPFVGRPGHDQGAETIWKMLRDEFVKVGLLDRSAAYRSGSVMRSISGVMQKLPELRVLAMFDEADYFLTRDAENNFRVVTDLRTLMNETSRRFKVIFAGLHRVQRFQGIPNQPLAHLGTPVLVGPLEPAAAETLVRRPLEALGFELSTEVVLQILSYTNYHPGLVQLFCDELLTHLYQTHAVHPRVPAKVQASDAETVYLKESVRRTILDRFDLTLNLDPRYKAIVWSMVVDQFSSRNGYADLYGPTELWRLVTGYWEAGFRSMAMDEFRGLLDELRDLGVLVRTSTGQYRLRSPNIVSLLGTQQSIEDRLLELGERSPELTDDPESYHALIDPGEFVFSPLTYSQARLLNSSPSKVGLILGSDALGMASMEKVLASALPLDPLGSEEIVLRDLPSHLTGKNLRRALTDIAQRQDRLGRSASRIRIMAYQRVGAWTPQELCETVNAALEVCKAVESTSRRIEMRVVFMLGPEAIRSWLALEPGYRERLENRIGAVIHLRRWNLAGVRQRLELMDKVDNEDACSVVLRSTGGWPWLLDLLMSRVGKNKDPRPAAMQLETELASSKGELRDRMVFMYPLTENSLEDLLLRQIVTDGPVPQELMVPDLLLGKDAENVNAEYLSRALQMLELLRLVEFSPESGYRAESVTQRFLA